MISFTLCGSILRLVRLTIQSFGTSRGFDLEDQNDHLEIIKIIALFTGPVHHFMPHWGPRETSRLIV
jgi:hypothetical protein